MFVILFNVYMLIHCGIMSSTQMLVLCDRMLNTMHNLISCMLPNFMLYNDIYE